jgi:Post-segregation antitoxin CcdA
MPKKPKRGGKREGAGRKPMGKAPYTVTLTEANVDKARRKESNLSGLLDQLLVVWLRAR